MKSIISNIKTEEEMDLFVALLKDELVHQFYRGYLIGKYEKENK